MKSDSLIFRISRQNFPPDKKTGLFPFFYSQPYPDLIQRLTIWGFGPELKEISSGGSFASS